MMYTRVYIGKLPRDCTEREVQKLAREFGPVRDIRLLSGFAFVEFEDDRDARDCVKSLDGDKFLGERLIVEPARQQGAPMRGRDYSPRRRGSDHWRRSSRSPPPRLRSVRTNYRVLVSNLPPRTSWQDLKDLMRKAGEVTYTDMGRDGVGYGQYIPLSIFAAAGFQ
ncbi:hypothetical protein HK104_010631 [Borealophlyctis nickersoniae]|nr:hypothetical protein HK104_010631 [Borealophlyctis nickersoniae]